MNKVEIEKPDEFLKLVQQKSKEYLYHDHPNDGIDFFCDDQLEQIGWHGVTFDCITYRDIANFIEENCKGTLYFNDHPMGFNGFVIVDDIDDVRKKVFIYVKDQIQANMPDELDEDQKEALEFFGLK
jgi:hypothetical protein